MIINIQNASTINIIGTHTQTSRKEVYDIDTATFYASVSDIAEALDVTPGAISIALRKERNCICKGHRICYVSRIIEHLDEINQINRARIDKIAAYEAHERKQQQIAKAEARLTAHKARIAELRDALAKEKALKAEAQAELETLKGE